MAPRKRATAKGETPGKQRRQVTDPKPAVTQEDWEQQLQSLAAKAKEQTWSKWAAEQAHIYSKAFAFLVLAAVYSNVSQLALSPVYGSIPSSIWHRWLVDGAYFIGWMASSFLELNLPFKTELLLPVMAFYIPVIRFCLDKASKTLTAYWGPLVTEALTLGPLMVLSAASVATHLDRADMPSFMSSGITGVVAPSLSTLALFKGVKAFSGRALAPLIGKSFLLTRLGLEVVLSICYSLVAPSKLLLFALPALLHSAFFNPHAPTSIALASLNTTLGAKGWMLLDRRESVTGYVSVLESKDQGFRVMRCDHSLLGGEWMLEQFKHNQVAEPIYGVFAMLEAVRLVEVPKPVPDDEAKALVIGMGIGTTPAALVAHGIDTTVVEIDPAVNEFASKYFRLPSNYTSVIEDAVTYTERLVKERAQRFDYIVHDVFTGGAEPIPLFTLEFLEGLAALLKPDGVIAINYAGDFTLPPPRVVVQTIRRAFLSCRIFREHAPGGTHTEKQPEHDFDNMVIFCTKRNDGINFRQPTVRDLLNSPTREQFLYPRFEVKDADFRARGNDGILTKDDTQKLVKWHEKSALGHWAIMRDIIPSFVWINW
ncbi:polyamine aminopropyltransferase [Diplogelasinospora grovesii]|uniref:Polyamine aminopropyltransferase n=1 Tax=Diplogelasinospora grovesii TaxID=303347 RepID=A0AAN6SA20_9PEZI|nr:polyamine aminopropyltransferase [Diplogelasinospora grovesii]